MSEFLENELKKALARSVPPDGFAERVMERVPQRKQERRTMWYAAIAAVLAFALIFAGVQQRRHMREKQAQQTERQVVFALSLAMRHLEHVNMELRKSAPTVKVEEKRGGEQL